MKNTIIALMFVAGTAMAGTASKEVMPPPPMIEEPSLWHWFIGGSGGWAFLQPADFRDVPQARLSRDPGDTIRYWYRAVFCPGALEIFDILEIDV